MNLIYGNFQHDPGDAEVSISREGMVSELGRMFAVRERWDIKGRLHGDNAAAVNQAVAALMAAYAVQGQDISLAGSSHIMRSSDTINGTRVVQPPSFPVGSGGENSTFRSYSLAVEGERAYVGNSILLSWSEAITFRGNGAPIWGFLECLNGPPQMQVFQQQSVCYASQRGSAICVPDTAHRNEYSQFWLPPDPAWPQWEHAEQRDITYELPSDLYGMRRTEWSYQFSANVQLRGTGLPNIGGIQMHLG